MSEAALGLYILIGVGLGLAIGINTDGNWADKIFTGCLAGVFWPATAAMMWAASKLKDLYK